MALPEARSAHGIDNRASAWQRDPASRADLPSRVNYFTHGAVLAQWLTIRRMSRKPLLLVLLCLCLPAISPSVRAQSAAISPSVHHQESAEQMVSYCRGFVDAKLSGDMIDFPTNYDSGMCWGAFAAFQTAIAIHQKGMPENVMALGVCAPAESRRSQLIQIFVTYAKQHPERYHENFFIVALDATQKAFRCSR